MASFQAKIGWKRPRKRKNKNFLSVPFLPRQVIENSKKREKKSKNQNIPFWLHSKPKQVGKGRRMEKIKIAVLFRSHSTRNRKFQKNQQENEKNDKNPLWHHFKPKQIGKGSEIENKNNRFVSFRSDPTRKRKFKTKQQKNSIN